MTRFWQTSWGGLARCGCWSVPCVFVVAGLMAGLGCASVGNARSGMFVEAGNARPAARLVRFQAQEMTVPPEKAVGAGSKETAAEGEGAVRAQTGVPEQQVEVDPSSGETEAAGRAEEVAPQADGDEMRRSVGAERGGEEQSAGVAGPAVTRSGYTAPSAAVRSLSLATSVGALGISRDESSAAEVAAESMILSSQGAVGQLGLTAPPTMVAGAVTSRSGLGRGPATGLGFAAMGSNLFSARVNRLSGVNGRCADLARAGFFGGDRHACERSFGR